MKDTIDVRRLGLGDPNFHGVNTLFHNDRPVAVSLSNAGYSGTTMYRVSPLLEKALTILAKADAKGAEITKGEHATTLVRAVTSDMKYGIGNSSPATNTFTNEGSTNALAAVHRKLHESGQVITSGSKALLDTLRDVFDGAEIKGMHPAKASHTPASKKTVAIEAVLSALEQLTGGSSGHKAAPTIATTRPHGAKFGL